MDSVYFTHLFLQALRHYGSFALFFSMVLGIVGLPIPDETLLVLAGILLAKGKLLFFPTIIAAYAGAMGGITVSYSIGYTGGHYLAVRYGKRLGITKKRLDWAHRQFERFGGWLLFFGFYLPGVRHLTGYVAGSVQLAYRRFACFAYPGALVWSSIFLTLGYFFGGSALLHNY